MVKRSRTEAHGLTAPKTGNRTPKWEKWPTATKCSPRPLRDGLQDLSLPSGKEIEKTESGSQTETRHRRGFVSPEVGLAAATLRILNDHDMQYHQVLNCLSLSLKVGQKWGVYKVKQVKNVAYRC
mgnify:CR=1 FL=1